MFTFKKKPEKIPFKDLNNKTWFMIDDTGTAHNEEVFKKFAQSGNQSNAIAFDETGNVWLTSFGSEKDVIPVTVEEVNLVIKEK